MEAAGNSDNSLPGRVLEQLLEVFDLQQPLPFQADAEQYNDGGQEIMICEDAENTDSANEEIIDKEAEDTDDANVEIFDEEAFDTDFDSLDIFDDEAFDTDFTNVEISDEEVFETDGANVEMIDKEAEDNDDVNVEIIDEKAKDTDIANEEMIDEKAKDTDSANEDMIDKEVEFIDNVNKLVTETISENANAANLYMIKVDTEATINVNESKEMDTNRNEAAASMSLEENEATIKFKANRDSFVDDLMKAVKQIRNELGVKKAEFEYLKEDIQTPYSCYFSIAHRYTIWKYIRSQKEYFNLLLIKYSKISKDLIFENCKKRFVEVYKPEEYSEVGFVNFCAAIAYLGMHCLDLNLDHNAEIKVKGYIGFLLWDVLRKGPLHTSSW